MSNKSYKPFLRWAGGKGWLLKKIDDFLPEKYNNYHEPFLGGGAVFFHLQPTGQVFLSDSNHELINAYTQIRDNVEKVISVLGTYKNTEKDYYDIRSTSYEDSIYKAAQFIYLNRMCFNGIYRVNKKGEYNVPYGFKQYTTGLFDLVVLRNSSKALKKCDLSTGDFEGNLNNIKPNDLVFLDPPYTVSHTKNGFVAYNEKLFSWKDQERLAGFIRKIKEKGAYYMLTNAKHQSIETLYGKLNKPQPITRKSTIGGKNARRGIYNEYVFSNAVRYVTEGREDYE